MYEVAIEWLFKQFPSYQKIGSSAYKPTLENTQALLSIYQHPERNLKFIHVAGSNGKGSVSCSIASILTEADYKVGLFTSPHIKDFTERIRINGVQMEKEFVIDFIDQLRKTPLDFDPSFFEITFVMALKYFEKEQCDICVIETGLGGRLDATNTITPLLSVITSISLEHTQILGNTIELIAAEKAGIIKESVPVVINPENLIAETVLRQFAENKNSRIIPLVQDIPTVLRDQFIADYQISNCKTILSGISFLKEAYQISDSNIIDGFKKISANTGYQGRLQIINDKPLTIVDVSHNPAGINATLTAIQNKFNKPLHIIFGFSNDKDISSIIPVLPENAKFYLTEFKNLRSAKIADLELAFSDKKAISKQYFADPQNAMKVAQTNATENDCILVMGSFFLIEHFF